MRQAGATRRPDGAQGKTFGAGILALELEVPEEVVAECARVLAGELPGRPQEEEPA